MFSTPKETQVLTENWRNNYNYVRPRSAWDAPTWDGDAHMDATYCKAHLKACSGACHTGELGCLIDRTKGGQNTKLHAICDGSRRIFAVHWTDGSEVSLETFGGHTHAAVYARLRNLLSGELMLAHLLMQCA